MYCEELASGGPESGTARFEECADKVKRGCNTILFVCGINLVFNIFRTEAHQELNAFRRKQDCALVVSGESLEVCLQYYQHEFMELATASPAVVCCRCSPTQKAQVVQLIQKHTGKRTCAVGDGGNDVSMIQQSDAGQWKLVFKYKIEFKMNYVLSRSWYRGPRRTPGIAGR